MEITIKEPATGEPIRLDVQPEDYQGEQGWRILYPQKDSFVIAREEGDWKAVDEQDMDPELITAIARAIDEKEPGSYTSMSSS
jgi:hypothetical protein